MLPTKYQCLLISLAILYGQFYFIQTDLVEVSLLIRFFWKSEQWHLYDLNPSAVILQPFNSNLLLEDAILAIITKSIQHFIIRINKKELIQQSIYVSCHRNDYLHSNCYSYMYTYIAQQILYIIMYKQIFYIHNKHKLLEKYCTCYFFCINFNMDRSLR